MTFDSAAVEVDLEVADRRAPAQLERPDDK